MVAVSVSLSDITQLSDLAAHLGVDVRALQLVSLHPTSICKGKTCILQAAESNRGYCILCAQQWFPRDTSAELNRRGHGLYGPKFMRIYNKCQSPPKACCCDTPLCEKIGYSHEGMFCLPSKSEKNVRDFVMALGIQDKNLRSKMISDPRSHRIAPWHISPDHREKVEGKWRLKKLDVYKDRDGKGWNFAPPNHALQDYVDVEIHEYRQQYEYCRNGYNDSLPNWFKKLARMQKKDMQITTTEASVTPSQDTSLPNSASASLSKPKRLTFATPASAPRPRSKRTAPETIEISNLTNKLQRVESVGIPWAESISEGYPGAASDPLITTATDILERVPYGCAVQVDKGFLIDNDCAVKGLICVRPQKMLKGQQQQSANETARHQKVGITRIPVEQMNGQAKASAGILDKHVRMDQVGLADLIFFSTFLLTNFKLPFIQDRPEDDENAGPRPCKAEIRYGGATDSGLVDARGEILLWGTKTEKQRWHELRTLQEYAGLSDSELSRKVLNENWPAKLKEIHIEKLNSLRRD